MGAWRLRRVRPLHPIENGTTMCSRFSELDDQARAALLGSEEGWINIYTILWGPAVEFVRRKIRVPRELAEEITQEAFIVALRKLDNWDPDRGRFVTWFFVITNARCLDHKRKNPRVYQPYSEEQHFDPPSPSAQASMEAVEYWQLLEGPLKQLTVRARDILFLKAVSGFKSHEIAAMMDTTPGAIRTSLSESRKRLRRALERREGER
jgi:RNA polymerase sigma-70 factor, ECF subfamily